MPSEDVHVGNACDRRDPSWAGLASAASTPLDTGFKTGFNKGFEPPRLEPAVGRVEHNGATGFTR
jgi:hypothetical protein